MNNKFLERYTELEVLNQIFIYSTATHSTKEFLSLILELLYSLFKIKDGAISIIRDNEVINVANEYSNIDILDIKNAPKHEKFSVYNFKNHNMELVCALSFGSKPEAKEEILLNLIAERTLLICRYKTKESELQEKLQKGHNKIHALSIKILNAYEEERRRIARDLHDEVSQSLTALKVGLQRTNAKVPSYGLNDSIELLNNTIIEIKRQISSIRPPSLEDMSINDAIRDIVREFEGRTDLSFVINDKDFSCKFPEEIEIVIYRCIQESLTNIIRHSKATEATVNLSYNNNVVYIEMKDNGVGFDKTTIDNRSQNIGIIGMQERVALLGGTVDILSSPGKGTVIKISIPVEDNQNL